MNDVFEEWIMIARKPLLRGWMFGLGLTLATAVHAGVNEWTAQGPNGGYVFALAIDPVTPTTLYAGTGFNSSGVYKTVDGGDRWTGVSNGLPKAPVEALVIDPLAPETVYCATWSGVYKTADGGGHWASSPGGMALGWVRDLAIDPVTPSTLYAGGEGVFKSTDGGATWSESSEGLGAVTVKDLAIAVTNPNILYAGTDGGVFKSTDGGGHWTDVSEGLPSLFIDVLTVDPSDPDIVYAVRGGLYKSTVGGGDWVPINEGLDDGVGGLPNIQSLAIDPTDSSTLYAGAFAGGGGIYKTTNAGANWALIAGPAAYPAAGLEDPDVWALAIDPSDPQTLFAGVSDQLECAYYSAGLYRSRDGGESWAVANTGLHATDVLALTIDPSDPSSLWAGVGDGGTRHSADGGATWQLADTRLDVSVTALAIDPAQPDTRYWGFDICLGLPGTGIFRTTHGETTDVSVGDHLHVLQLLADPRVPATLYALTGPLFSDHGSAYKSSDRGESWTSIGEGIPETTILALGSSAGSLYAGTLDGVFQSTDGGSTWAAANAGLEETKIQALVVAPGEQDILYAGTTHGVFKSMGGGSWFPVGLADQSIHALAVDPRSPATVYAGGDGAFLSIDGGSIWQDLSAGLEGSSVRSLVIHPQEPDQVFAATDRGVYDFNRIEPCVAGESNLCLSSERFRVDVDWRSFDGTTGTGQVVPVGSEDSGLMWFFEEDNWELLVKVLDACAINDRFWVFAAATTTVEYTLSITDTETGARREYHNPLGRAAPAITDTAAFDGCSARVGTASSVATMDPSFLSSPITSRGSVAFKSPEKATDACTSSATRMCLSDGRFSVEVGWTAATGQTGAGQIVDVGSSDASGLFWFFSPTNWEMLVKVLDACDTHGQFLFLGAASTDVEYQLTVTDRVADVSWELVNPQGNPSAAFFHWFGTCPQ